MRKLNDKFITNLQAGELNCLLRTVKSDDTLCLELRDNYINVYYRGGNLLTIKQEGDRYIFYFDKHYCINNEGMWRSPDLASFTRIEDYISAFPLLKREMDHWFSKNQKLEREFQQLILRENNCSTIANDTDYFISDIEYANQENKSRFDMVGIKWSSTAAARKNVEAPSLALFELKYGDSAMTGAAGIVKHFIDIEKFVNSEKMISLYSEVTEQFNQKVSLGLMGSIDRKIKIDQSKKPEFIIICVNHKPASSTMKRELRMALETCPNLLNKIDIKMAESSLMGYGLYESCMLPLFEYINL
ncbi:hypothetical protein [Anaerocolumna xylanovorans]|nr:hypothetical protein [Anaerocolumna xylanovorans]